MAKSLNEVGVEARKNAKGQIYDRTNVYSAENDAAKTHDDANHPHGKGTPDKGYLYTKDGGGSYDKFGKDGNGEGRNSIRMNDYREENSYFYNHPEIDETTEGQYLNK